MLAPFKKIIERDKGRKSERGVYETGDADGRRKILATKELAFIYFYADPRSPYTESYLDLRERAEKIMVRLGMPENWKLDSVVQEAIDFYLEEIKDDFDVKYLQSNIVAAERTIKYLENVDYDMRDTKGNLLYKPQDVVKVIKESGGVLESLKTLREKAFKKMNLSIKIRGGGDVNLFERREVQGRR
jgi:hypothetical protein